MGRMRSCFTASFSWGDMFKGCRISRFFFCSLRRFTSWSQTYCSFSDRSFPTLGAAPAGRCGGAFTGVWPGGGRLWLWAWAWALAGGFATAGAVRGDCARVGGACAALEGGSASEGGRGVAPFFPFLWRVGEERLGADCRCCCCCCCGCSCCNGGCCMCIGG